MGHNENVLPRPCPILDVDVTAFPVNGCNFHGYVLLQVNGDNIKRRGRHVPCLRRQTKLTVTVDRGTSCVQHARDQACTAQFSRLYSICRAYQNNTYSP